MPTTDNSSKPATLKTTRESKGLTLEIVHEATKIPMDALRAIEEGYSVRILSPFYYRGFIKIYSEFLGLNTEEMYKEYSLDQAPKPASSLPPSIKTKKPVEVKPNVFVENLQEGVSSVFTPNNFALVAKIAGFLILFLLLFKIGGCVASHLGKKGPVIKKHNSVFVEHSLVAPPVAAAVNRGSVNAQSENDMVEVAVRASKDTWLRVKTDDKVVFETTLSKGSMETWTANDRIELSGRDIEQLDMEVNQKHIGFLGGGERRIRRVLITQEGLTVKK